MQTFNDYKDFCEVQLEENEADYDILAEFSIKEVAEAAATLIDGLRYHAGTRYCTAETTLGEYRIKAYNTERNSWLSVSSPDETRVSRCLVFIVPPTGNVDESDTAYILDMINEAWYSLNND